ncbi:hypothetical protein BRD01_09235 [Halobacteriales archaeon QS_8_65_32]|nr:MAG: hypothetical protein BRD01_09235 [Halobacteriales archaeon QS_8_65_32]
MEFGAIAIWLLACLLLAVAGWPLAAVVFRSMPDRGAALALPVALAAVTVVTYWIGHLSISIGLLVGCLVLLVAAAFSLRRLTRSAADGTEGSTEDLTDDVEGDRSDSIRIRLRRRLSTTELSIPAVFEALAVFVLAFLVLIAIRAVDPAVHPGGGEKFLDFGLLTSLLRASQLPPEDFWFAGESVQYYYGGHLIASLLARLTGIDPRYAYNLALATFYASLVTAAYGFAGAIAADHGASRRIGGVLAAFVAGFAANLVTALYVVLWVLPASVAGFLASVVSGRSALSADALLRPPGEYSYWTASRVIEGTVNEFPLFAWLNGDLHAHMMSTPFLLCVAAIGYAYAHTPATERRRRRWLLFGASPPLIGLLAVVNTWSLPTAVGLLWLALTFSSAHPATLLPASVAGRLLVVERRTLVRELARIGTALLLAAGVLVGALVWSLPFWLESASGRGVALVTDRSGLLALLLIYGAFLAVFVPYLFDRARPSLGDPFRAGVALLLLFGLAFAGEFAALGVLGPLLIVAWLLLRGNEVVPARLSKPVKNASRRLLTSGGRDLSGSDGTSITESGPKPDPGSGTDSSDKSVDTTAAGRTTTERADTDGTGAADRALGDVGYETTLIVAGLGLVVLVEFLRVDTGAGPGRYNTVFKTYMQVWVLWAVATGAILARFLTSDTVGRRSGVGRRGARVLVAVLVVSTSLYAGLVLADHFGDPNPDMVGNNGPTIDALAFVPATHPEEAAAIRWLDDRTGDRQPNMVAAPGTDTYAWTNAPASLTGVPTVVGWSHEVGYRGSEAYYERVEDVDQLYTGSPRAQTRLLREYDVRYIYVGPNERDRYGTELGFDGLGGLDIAFRNDAVTIYAVDSDRLAPRS